MQHKKVLILVGVFFATLPISYIINAFFPFGIRIFDALISLGVYRAVAADIAYLSATILTSLFITFVAWLFMAQIKNQKAPILVLVFFATLPVSLILNLFNPLTRLISNILLPITRDNVSAFFVPLFTLTILTSLFLTCITWYFSKSRRTQTITKHNAHIEKRVRQQNASEEGI